MNFLVAGCGIGGLSTAHALINAGHEVRLLEQSCELKPVGAGISLQPNAMQALRRLGIDQRVNDGAWEADKARILLDSGKVVTRLDFSNYPQLFGYLPQTIYRGDLIRVLSETLDDSKTEIVLNEQVESFEEQPGCVTVSTRNGSRYECDGLIGADGIHSAVRRQLWGETAPRYAGYTCWRGMINDPSLVKQIDTLTEVWGKGARFGFMRCNARQVYWFATENRKTRSDDDADEAWKSRFQSWVSPIPELLEATLAGDIIQNDIVDLKPLFPWGRGRVTLLGDAAHAMTPNFGQGGAQAIEDAAVLGLVFQRSPRIEDAFRAYESTRRKRVHSLVKGSRQFGMIGQGGHWMFRMVRNHLMPNLPKAFVDSQLGRQCDFEGFLKRHTLG